MNLTNLTNQQLYEVIQNEDLDKGIRRIANDELNCRKLDVEQIKQLIAHHDLNFKPKSEPLETKYKMFVLLFPFFIPIQSVFAGKWLANGHKRKWKEYWLYLSLGYLLWTIIVMIIARYFLKAH
jgi:uncharacterized membrane protein